MLQEHNYDWALSIAYNAMLQAARALMYFKGYRASSSGGHYAVIQFVKTAFTKEFSEETLRYFDKLRHKRHMAVYEEADLLSAKEAAYAIEEAQRFLEKAKNLAGV